MTPMPPAPAPPLTPMMQQYRDAKLAHPGMLVLFRNGDFYELFESDAELGSRLLGITLTKRDSHIPMAGFPVHKLEHYLNVLLKSGHRVAVCEQMEEAGAAGKKIIRREVNRVVTPGTVTEDELLDPRRPNHIVAVSPRQGQCYGLAWADLSTGSFHAADVSGEQLGDEVARLGAVECLLPDDRAEELGREANGALPSSQVARPAWTFDPATAAGVLKAHFRVATFAGFGFRDGQPALAAAGALLSYLQETLKASLAHLGRLTPHRPECHLVLDETTRRSLELTRTLRDNVRSGSLLDILDRTVTPMGARHLHDALLAPLCDRAEIVGRLDAVEEFVRDHGARQTLRSRLEATSDLQRLAARSVTARATPKDLAAIARTLKLLPPLKAQLTARRATLLNDLEHRLELCPDLRASLESALVDEPPYSAKEGGVVREGFHAELDELRKLARDGRDWIARYQAQEITRTGITSLKVGFTDVMGYYIEITNANETRVPADYVHERTLKNAKRFSTPRLKEYEEKVVTAQERSQALEFDLFSQLRESVAAQSARLLQTAEVLATLDFLAALAELAASRNYVRPTMTDEPVLEVVAARHPVLDLTLPAGTVVPNDIRFHPAEGVFWLVTGPNMSGKSTFIRQVALVTILAHVGSFVPAESARVGITDRIFTRVGASDELSRGQSTFMVEMTEAANILNNATSRSLVILDEIGRGTSTYDGVSLAWAITEYLHDQVGCRALFATHYHELAQLAGTLPRLRNYTVQVRETADDVVFLHSIAPGSAQKSFGIHVAKLAGMPAAVLERARSVLGTLEAATGPLASGAVWAVPAAPEVVAAPAVGVAPEPAAPEAVAEVARPAARARPERQLIEIEPPERPRRRGREPGGPNLFGDGGQN